MGVIKAGGFFKGDHSALQSVLKMHTFAMSLCCGQKALLEPHSVSGQLCACVLSKPLVHSPSVCTTIPQSTHSATLHSQSTSLFLTFCIFQFTLCQFFCCYLSFCSTDSMVLFLSLVLCPEALCKATRKGLLAMPVCASMLLSIHFRSFPFFSVTCSHKCCCFRRTESQTTWLQGVKNKNHVYFILSVYLFEWWFSLFSIFLPH